jgi:O-antigen/teichoic acid export membrane protein
LIVSYLYLLAGSLGGQIIGFVMLALVARRIGPDNLGAYNFANNISSFFALPLMAGVAMVGMRDVAVADRDRVKIVDEVQGFLLVNGLLAYALLIVVTPLLTTDPLAREVMPFAGATLVLNPLGLDWAMQGLQRARPLAVMRFGGQVAYAIVMLALLEGGQQGTVRYAVANAIGFAVTALATLIYVRRRIGFHVQRGIDLAGLGGRIWHRARISLAPAASLVMIQVYYSSDIVILGYRLNYHAVGLYSASERLPIAAAVVSSLWVSVFYPHAAQLAQASREVLRIQVGEFATIAIIISLPLVPFGFVLGHQVMAGMFGQAFSPAATSFAMLFVGAAAQILNSTIAQTLLASRDDRAFLLTVSFGAVVNIGLNFALIPVLGIDGSALATVAAEVLIIALATIRFGSTVGYFRIEWKGPLRAGVAVGGAAVVALLTRDILAWWLASALYGVVCAALLLATRAIDPRDVRRLRRAG